MVSAIMQGQGQGGNPSSLHEEGRAARGGVEGARRKVAALLGAAPEEIVFTSGGTEGNNAALLGTARAARRAGRPGRVLSSPLEHPSVRAALAELQQDGFEVALLPVDRRGRIDPADLRRALSERPALLVSLALCNHEIGNLYPVAELCRLSHEHGALFHCDAVQAAGRVPFSVRELGVDLLTLSAHKLHGPKGAGALYVRAAAFAGPEAPPAPLPLLLGGPQEKGRRAGTENVIGILGFGRACELARERLAGTMTHVGGLRDRLEAELLQIEGAQVEGDRRPGGRAPGTLSVRFAGVEGDLLMMNLDLRGVAVSTGAACSSGSLSPSPVLLALGLSEREAGEGVRISLGAGNTQAEVEAVVGLMREAVVRIRAAALPGVQ